MVRAGAMEKLSPRATPIGWRACPCGFALLVPSEAPDLACPVCEEREKRRRVLSRIVGWDVALSPYRD